MISFNKKLKEETATNEMKCFSLVRQMDNSVVFRSVSWRIKLNILPSNGGLGSTLN